MSAFSIQLDESTDVTNCYQLHAYVRFVPNHAIKTKFMLSHGVSTTTNGKDIFKIFDKFFKKNELDWEKLVRRTTDETSSMLNR